MSEVLLSEDAAEDVVVASVMDKYEAEAEEVEAGDMPRSEAGGAVAFINAVKDRDAEAVSNLLASADEDVDMLSVDPLLERSVSRQYHVHTDYFDWVAQLRGWVFLFFSERSVFGCD